MPLFQMHCKQPIARYRNRLNRLRNKENVEVNLKWTNTTHTHTFRCDKINRCIWIIWNNGRVQQTNAEPNVHEHQRFCSSHLEYLASSSNQSRSIIACVFRIYASQATCTTTKYAVNINRHKTFISFCLSAAIPLVRHSFAFAHFKVKVFRRFCCFFTISISVHRSLLG